MPPASPRWLDVVRHRVRGFRVPFLLVLQHHAIRATSRLVAPVSPSLPNEEDVLAPPIQIDGVEYRVRLLDISALPLTLLGETVTGADHARDAILAAIDVILHGYPVGRPH